MKYAKFIIIDYLGKIDGKIFLSLGVVLESQYYECNFMYDNEGYLFIPSDELESIFPNAIEESEGYEDFISDILSQVKAFKDCEDMNDFDIEVWLNKGKRETNKSLAINKDDII